VFFVATLDEKFLKREHHRAVAAPGYRSLRALEKARKSA